MLIPALLIIVLIGQPAQATLRLPRRNFLNLGAWSLLGLKAPPAPAAPVASVPPAAAVVSVPSPAMLEYRSRQLREVMRGFTPGSGTYAELMREGLSDLDRLIIADWRAHDPAARGFIDAELAKHARLVAELDDDRLDLSERNDAFGSRRLAIRDHVDQIKAKITDWPWSTFDWTHVFLERIGRAEAELGPALGVDAAQIFRLTEHAADPLGRRGGNARESLVDTLAEPVWVPAIYSSRTVEMLAQAVGRVHPLLGAKVREVNSDLERGADHLRVRVVLAASQQRASYQTNANWPLRFVFQDVFDDVPEAESLVPAYLKLRARFVLMRERTNTLDRSDALDLIQHALVAVLADLDAELATLRERLDAIGAAEGRYPRAYLPRKPETPMSWDTFASNARAGDPTRALHWMSVLRAAAARYRVDLPFANEPNDADAAECTKALGVDPAVTTDDAREPARLEHRPVLDLDVNPVKDEIFIEKDERP